MRLRTETINLLNFWAFFEVDKYIRRRRITLEAGATNEVKIVLIRDGF
jgi:hypothetical protein